MKKRLDYIDAAKGFGMLLIIWGHVATIPNGISVWASGFKVSLFFVVSGLLTACSFTQQPSKKLAAAVSGEKTEPLAARPLFWFFGTGNCRASDLRVNEARGFAGTVIQ